ncbi:MAG TPA: glycosyltransferase family A protein [Planctomycetaceae bacterium]|nr:glycosyltransferase family A protein [Planctomycetaceae bacterium]
MSQSPFFSVVIPTYNRADLLRQALESVSRQEFQDFEVIVVDDGSTEDLSSVVAAFDRTRLIRQANAGPSAARNNGLRAAAGEYVAFLDSDDLWLPWTLSTYHDSIVNHGQPAFVAGCPQVFQAPRELQNIERASPQTLAFSDYFQSGDAWRWFGVSSFVIRRSVLVASGGFATTMKHAEDADLALLLGTAPGFVQVTSPVTFGYRQGASDQLTGQFHAQLPATLTLIANEAAGRYPGAAARAVERRRIISRHARPVALALLREREFVPGWKLYLSLLAWNVRLGQWKFVLGFPAWAIWRQVAARITSAMHWMNPKPVLERTPAN